ncbi:hypothetical protein BO99DRAFT_405788 [Aspergillus violaceofuscus CBS 115571]|uniref:Uncharacterized protein n=1 Tax=Aspergillus violaceofuscus (strain CBS 115571) TaxID=1450538 RepID=A0A2V5H1N1_ASPV1|nr:hypothetical protein BO99DRAFT_405788 [Aspergillus violaceofuscus CBS 115571]
MCTHYYTTCCSSILDSCAKGNKTREIKRIPAGEYRNDIPSTISGYASDLSSQNGQPNPASANASRVVAAETDPGTDARGAARMAEERSGQPVSQPVSQSRSSFEGTATASHVLRLAASTVDGRKARDERGKRKKKKKERRKIQKERKQKIQGEYSRWRERKSW